MLFVVCSLLYRAHVSPNLLSSVAYHDVGLSHDDPWIAITIYIAMV